MEGAERQLDQLAEGIRGALVERRRNEAAAGRASSQPLPAAVRELIGERAAVLPEAMREQLEARILRDTVGLGPLEELLADPEVEEVMVNGPQRIYAERRGRIES